MTGEHDPGSEENLSPGAKEYTDLQASTADVSKTEVRESSATPGLPQDAKAESREVISSAERMEAFRALARPLYGEDPVLVPLAKGGNHQLFVIQPNEHRREKAVAKFYDPSSSRADRQVDVNSYELGLNPGMPNPFPPVAPGKRPQNRQAIEAGALRCLKLLGVSHVPQLLGSDRREMISIQTFLEGREKNAGALTIQDMHAVVDFITTLQQTRFDNRHNNHEFYQAQLPFELPGAPQVRRSLNAHLAITQTRLDRFASDMARLGPIHEDVYGDPHLLAPPQPILEYVRDNDILNRCKTYDVQLRSKYQAQMNITLPHEQLGLCDYDLSPHNMLFTDDATVNFVDFELFGWGDPAYALTLMLCHNRMLGLPLERRDETIAYYRETAPVRSSIKDRIQPLLALGHLDWVSMCLDSTRGERISLRQYANPDLQPDEFAELQIANIEKHLDRLDALINE